MNEDERRIKWYYGPNMNPSLLLRNVVPLAGALLVTTQAMLQAMGHQVSVTLVARSHPYAQQAWVIDGHDPVYTIGTMNDLGNVVLLGMLESGYVSTF